jgi:hypothetical protein
MGVSAMLHQHLGSRRCKPEHGGRTTLRDVLAASAILPYDLDMPKSFILESTGPWLLNRESCHAASLRRRDSRRIP